MSTTTTEPAARTRATGRDEGLPTTGRPQTVQRLLDGLLKLSGTMAARSRAWAGDAEGLTRGDLSVLGTLAVHGPRRNGVLATYLQVGAPVMSRQVAALEAQGLVARTPDPDDGRAELVSLTDEGAERLDRARAAVCARLAERVESWDEEHLARASTYVEELVTVLNPTSHEPSKEAHV